MVKVIVPNKAYRGVIADVQFHNGIGEFEDEKLAEKIAKQFGFEIEREEKPEPKKVEKPAPKKRKTSKKAGDE